MRIVHVIPSLAPKFGGPSAAILPMCSALTRRGHSVELVTTDQGGAPGAHTVDAHPDVSLTVHHARPSAYAVAPRSLRTFRRLLPRADVLHVHGVYSFPSLVASLTALAFDVPFVVRTHGSLNPYHRRRSKVRKAVFERIAQHRVLRRAAGFHVTSEAEAASVQAMYPEARIYVVPLGVEMSPHAAEPGDATDDFGGPLVCFLGRLTEKKGLDVLARAFARVAAGHPDAHLVIAGPDEEGIGAQVRATLADAELSNRVSFLGLVTGEDKTRLLRQATVFVLPSEDENFAVAVVEALSAGTPVVVTHGVALHPQISAARVGFVVERSPESVAEAVSRIISDKRLAREMSCRATRFAAARFTWCAVAEALERMYVEIVDDAHRARRNR